MVTKQEKVPTTGDDYREGLPAILSVKLPESGKAALRLPFASPTEYGLGKSGWVTARFTAKDKPPVEMLRKWIDESYRAVAPKELIKALDQAAARPAPRRIRYRKRRP